MTYTSFNFLLFVLLTVLIYFIFPVKKYKWTVLLAANTFFYFVASYQYSAFILFTTATTYFISLWLNRVTENASSLLKSNKGTWDKDQKKIFKNKIKIKKRLIMAIAMVLNFGILAFLKYYNLFAGSLNGLLGSAGIDFSAPTLKLLLPLGISFYTFTSMGYIVDVYRENTSVEKNPLKLLLFVSFFPNIIQGPISTYSQLAPQLYEGHSFDFTRFKHGCELILWGFFKKLVIADRTAIAITAATENYGSLNGTTLTFVILLYALQIYTDFSGGIDISRGVAQIFGIDLLENFKRPYFARSINEYWRRWHISLGAWMKNYIFYPMAMSNLFLNTSKKIKSSKFGKTAVGAHLAKVLPTSIASLIVFILVGIWHGSSLKYVAFGIWNGGIIMISILMQPLFDKILDSLHIKRKNPLFILFQILRTFLIVLIGYVFDVAPSFKESINTIRLFFINQNLAQGLKEIAGLGVGKKEYLAIFIFMCFLFVISVVQEKLESRNLNIRQALDEKPFIFRWITVFVGLLTVIIFGVYGSGFNPANFVYMQF